MTDHYFESTYTFTLIKAGWGIYAQIKAEVNSAEKSSYSGKYRISDRIWFTFNNKVLSPPEDRIFMLNGLTSVSEEIEAVIDEDIVIAMTHFQIALCDYQKEGMFYAFAAWARNHFGLPEKEINSYFDQENNRYVFPDLMEE